MYGYTLAVECVFGDGAAAKPDVLFFCVTSERRLFRDDDGRRCACEVGGGWRAVSEGEGREK